MFPRASLEPAMSDFQIEYLTDELKQLVGWGASPKRLPLLPTLRAISEVGEVPSLVIAGYLIRNRLIAVIAGLDGSYAYDGRIVEARAVKRALRVLLALERSRELAENRRYEAMRVLGTHCSIETWRRPHGPERDILHLLAEALDRASYQTSEAVPA